MPKCEYCGYTYPPDEQCFCQNPSHILLTFKDGDTVFTRFNGDKERVINYYQGNPRVVSILFQDTGELFKF